jgi:ribosomal 30S subunit maturation factor RimM
LGVVSGFLDIPGNPCLQVAYNNRELIIPFNEAIVVQTNVKKRLLETLLPEGLLEL